MDLVFIQNLKKKQSVLSFFVVVLLEIMVTMLEPQKPSQTRKDPSAVSIVSSSPSFAPAESNAEDSSSTTISAGVQNLPHARPAGGGGEVF